MIVSETPDGSLKFDTVDAIRWPVGASFEFQRAGSTVSDVYVIESIAGHTVSARPFKRPADE